MGILSNSKGGSLDEEREVLQKWLRDEARLGPCAEVHSLTGNLGGSGFSNETLFATVASALDDRKPEKFVVRYGPTDPSDALFPDYDIAKQYNVMKALRDHTDVPVAEMLWNEPSLDYFGTPFFVMRFVEGRVPADQPPYATKGFVIDASREQRELLYRSSIEAIAKVGNVDLDRSGLGFLLPERSSRPPVQFEIDTFENVLRWGRQGSAPFPKMERALAWLRENAPDDEPQGLIWGDARFANIMFDENCRCISLLDWELATIGNPISDLAYFLFFQHWMENHYIPELSAPRPDGFLNDQDTIAYYEQVAGRKAEHLTYYLALNIFRMVATFQRFADLMVKGGRYTREEAEEAKLSAGSIVDWLMLIVDGSGPSWMAQWKR